MIFMFVLNRKISNTYAHTSIVTSPNNACVAIYIAYVTAFFSTEIHIAGYFLGCSGNEFFEISQITVIITQTRR